MNNETCLVQLFERSNNLTLRIIEMKEVKLLNINEFKGFLLFGWLAV